MPIKKKFFYIPLLLFFFLPRFSSAQVVWDNPNNPVLQFLTRQAQKGNVDLDDIILPLSRKTIAEKLQTLTDSARNLSQTERQELEFYKIEYSEFIPVQDSTIFLKKDQQGRLRFLTINKGQNILRGDPVLGLETFQGNNKSIIKRTQGLQFWGHISKNFSYQGYFAEITETGTNIDTLKQFNNETGIVRTVNLKNDQKLLNYTDVRGNFTYSWNSGFISAGKDQLLYGYGENGRLILSDKSPAYPFVRFEYQPLKWLKFQYSHAWLQSGIIDSASTYSKGNNVYGSVREVYVPKFMASHSLNFYPTKGLSLSIGESMVYSDRLDVGYLIPLLFFKAYDQYSSRYKISTGSNGQFFFQVSSRNHIPKTHIYGNLFIDEIRVTEVFNQKKSRNQVGFNAGLSVTDVLVNYLTLGMEYTRINPFVYQNVIPAQAYTNQNYLLGDWIGQNADRLTAWVKYNPVPRLSTSLELNYVRKGADGSIEDQYYAEPQPGFLAGPITNQKQMTLQAKYEIIHQLRIYGSYIKQAGIIRPTLQQKAVPNEFRFGISAGF